jgi:5-methyltetrahydrofolate--homocysteine methyltransferase
VGGAPVNQSFADEIGADGHGINAGQAAELMKKMLN